MISGLSEGPCSHRLGL